MYYKALENEFGFPPDPHAGGNAAQLGQCYCKGNVTGSFNPSTLQQHAEKLSEAIAKCAPARRDERAAAAPVARPFPILLTPSHAFPPFTRLLPPSARCAPGRRDEREGADKLHLALALILKEGNTASFSTQAPLPKRQRVEATQYVGEIAWPRPRLPPSPAFSRLRKPAHAVCRLLTPSQVRGRDGLASDAVPEAFAVRLQLCRTDAGEVQELQAVGVRPRLLPG